MNGHRKYTELDVRRSEAFLIRHAPLDRSECQFPLTKWIRLKLIDQRKVVSSHKS